MKTNSKFLPGFSPKLQGRQRRRQLETLRRQRDKARSDPVADFGTLFDFVLPLEKLREAATDARERTFPEPVTFWGRFGQIVGGNASCASAVAMVQNWFEENSLPVPSAGSSSFCRARGRLSVEFLERVGGLIGSHADAKSEQWQLWRGLRAKAVDGTTFRLDDTPESQSDYPQPSGQKPGCGFPVMGVVGTHSTCRPDPSSTWWADPTGSMTRGASTNWSTLSVKAIWSSPTALSAGMN